LAGASGEALDGIRSQINSMKMAATEMAVSTAQAVAEMNVANQVSTSEAIDNIMASMPSNSIEGRTVDKYMSEQLGFLADETGAPVLTDADGMPIATKTDGITYKTVTNPYTGEIYFYDPNNPTNIMPLGTSGSSYMPQYNQYGEYSSAPTSYTGERVDITDQYSGAKREHADNCALFARDNVPNIPYGAYSIEGRRQGLLQAEQQGIGGFDTSQIRVGDAIHTKEGPYGHSAIVRGIDANGNMTLEEANYTPGRITYGRTLNINDPKVMGYVRPEGGVAGARQTLQQGARNIASEKAPFLSTMFGAMTGQQEEVSRPAVEESIGTSEAPAKQFSSGEMKQYYDYLTTGKMPTFSGISQYQKDMKQQEFMNNASIFNGQRSRGEVSLADYDPIAYKKMKDDFVTNDYVKALKMETEILPKMKQYRDLVAKNGFEYVGGDKQLMEAIHKEISTTWKDIKGLGALTGPDMALIEGALPQAHSAPSNIAKSLTFVSPQDVVNVYDDWIKKAEKETEANIKVINSLYSDLRSDDVLTTEVNKYYDYKPQDTEQVYTYESDMNDIEALRQQLNQ